MNYLLDSNPCIQYLRGKNAAILQHFAAHAASEIAVCSVVVGELRFGAECSANPLQEHARLDGFLAPYVSLPYDDNTARIYATIRKDLASRGVPIGPYDFQIAAVALANDLILVTHNTGEFSRVSGLKLEDWEIP